MTFESVTEPEAEPTPQEETKPEPAKRSSAGRPTKEESDKQPTIFEEFRARWKAGMYAYIYRTQPYTNKLLGGTRHVHVRRYDEPFDADDLMNYAGSGAYMLMLTEPQPDGKTKRVFQGDIKLLDYNRPPKLPPGEWIDDPRNKEWEWAKEFIFPKKEEPAPKNDPLVEILRDELRAAREESRLARADANKKDPGEQSLLAALLNRVMQPAPPPPPPPDPMANIAAIIQIAKALQPAPPPPPAPSPFEAIAMELVKGKITGTEKSDFEKFLEFKEKFDAAAPAERRGKKDGWDHAVEMVEALQLGPALAPIAQIIAMKMMQAPPQPGQQQHAPPPPQHAPQMPPPGTPEPQQQAPPNAPRPQAVPDQPSVPVFAKAVLEHLQKDWSGLDLGDWYLKRYGMKEFEDIRKQGKDEVLTLLKSVPESFAPLESFHTAGKLEPMIEEFLDWEPEPQQPAAPTPEPNKPNWNNPAVGVEVQQQ